MKVRSDFVTNSSSSSFVIAKKYLDDDQIKAIRKHGRLGRKLGFSCCNETWHINENAKFITGSTDLDNFDMDSFLAEIDVDCRKVEWSDLPIDLSNVNYKPDWRDLLDKI